MRFLLLFVLAPLLAAQSSAPGETHRYTVSWPSGLSLGEGEMTRNPADGGSEYKLVLEASVPGFPVRDEYTSHVNAEGCSLEFTKDSTHGSRKASEKSSFDLAAHTMVRETLTKGGGKSEVSISGCPHDALAYLFFLSKELAGGRLPAPETVYFGAGYKVNIVYGGAQKIQVGDQFVDADRLNGSIEGPASKNSFEAYFARDDKRTLVLVKVPFSLGTFAMQLVP